MPPGLQKFHVVIIQPKLWKDTVLNRTTISKTCKIYQQMVYNIHHNFFKLQHFLSFMWPTIFSSLFPQKIVAFEMCVRAEQTCQPQSEANARDLIWNWKIYSTMITYMKLLLSLNRSNCGRAIAWASRKMVESWQV